MGLLRCVAVLYVQSVPNTMAGTVMAMDMSLASGLRTLSPLIGTYLVQQHGFQGVCVTAAAVLLTTFGAAGCLQPGLDRSPQHVDAAAADMHADMHAEVKKTN